MQSPLTPIEQRHQQRLLAKAIVSGLTPAEMQELQRYDQRERDTAAQSAAPPPPTSPPE